VERTPVRILQIVSQHSSYRRMRGQELTKYDDLVRTGEIETSTTCQCRDEEDEDREISIEGIDERHS
jgi:hypothetical protein